jgi:hypothetical protein
MRDVIPKLPPTILPLGGLNINVRHELVEIAEALFNDNKGAVWELAKRLFIDDNHAGFFMRYVYEYRKDVIRLVFAPHYLAIIMMPKPYQYLKPDFAIGVNDYRDGLFMSELDLTRISYTTNKLCSDIEKCVGKIIVAAVGDDAFRAAFGYDRDVLGQEAVITTGGRYRVQGEVVFNIEEVGGDYPKRLFNEQILRSISIYTADIVMRILIDHGISPVARVGGNGEVLVRVPVIPHGIDECLRIIAEILGKYFTAQYSTYFTMKEVVHSLWISNNEVAAEMEANINDESIDFTIEPWLIEPTKQVYNKMINMITGDIKDMLNNSERIDELLVGRHYIKIERGLPVNFTYEPELKPKILEPVLITVHKPRTFLVTPRSVVTIEHPQHGVKRIRFNGTYELTVNTTRVSGRQIVDMNTIVFGRLLGKEAW